MKLHRYFFLKSKQINYFSHNSSFTKFFLAPNCCCFSVLVLYRTHQTVFPLPFPIPLIPTPAQLLSILLFRCILSSQNSDRFYLRAMFTVLVLSQNLIFFINHNNQIFLTFCVTGAPMISCSFIFLSFFSSPFHRAPRLFRIVLTFLQSSVSSCLSPLLLHEVRQTEINSVPTPAVFFAALILPMTSLALFVPHSSRFKATTCRRKTLSQVIADQALTSPRTRWILQHTGQLLFLTKMTFFFFSQNRIFVDIEIFSLIQGSSLGYCKSAEFIQCIIANDASSICSTNVVSMKGSLSVWCTFMHVCKDVIAKPVLQCNYSITTLGVLSVHQLDFHKCQVFQ